MDGNEVESERTERGGGKSLPDSLLGETIATVAANLRRIAVLCLLVLVASSIYALTRDIWFSSSALLMVPGAASSSMGLEEMAGELLPQSASGLAEVGMSAMGVPSGPDITVAMTVLSSRPVLERLMLETGYMEEHDSDYSTDMALEEFGTVVSATMTDQGFVELSGMASSREDAALLVSRWISIANEELSQMITSRARRARIETQKALRLQTDSLAAVQRRMEEFRAETGVYYPETQAEQAVELLAGAELDLISAETELAALRGSVSPQNPLYREAQRRVNFLRDYLERRLTEGDSLSVFPGMEGMPQMIRRYEELFLEMETRTVTVTLLRQQLEQLKVQELKESPTLEVVVPPTPRFERSEPYRSRIVITHVLAAFLLSLLWILVLTYLRRIDRDRELGGYWRGVLRQAGRQLYLIRRHRGDG
ncbi:MAG: hypothetical protein R6U36_12375 [Candidatus Fermentibacteraceae bacterium]